MVRMKLGRNRRNRCQLLHQGGLSEARLRGLQGRRHSEEAVQQPWQNDEPQADGNVRRLPACVKFAVKRARFMALMPGTSGE